ALAVLGCMLGYERISDERKDADLAELIRRIAFQESMPVVVNPGIIDPVEFARQVIEERLPNPFIPDTPQRIATDTSQKLAIRFGNTIRAYEADAKLDVQSLRYIPFVLAAWCRYLLAVDDNGQPFQPSADPMLAVVQAHVAGITLGSTGSFHQALQPILSNGNLRCRSVCSRPRQACGRFSRSVAAPARFAAPACVIAPAERKYAMGCQNEWARRRGSGCRLNARLMQ
ncbi:MAG: hypothetical protein ACLUI3_17435, partial [Christensenellales bacterium]